MLSDRDKVKTYIGREVILAKCPEPNAPGVIEIVVGHLYDYCYLAVDLPFGTAVMMGATKFSVNVNADEYRSGGTSWSFPTQGKLEEWATNLPARIDFLESQLPAGSTMDDIHGVVAVVPLQPGMLTEYFEKANELFELANDTTSP